MTVASKGDRALEERLKPYVKRDSLYSIVLSLAGIAALVLVLQGSVYSALAVIVFAIAGVARYSVRKKKLRIRADFEAASDPKGRGVRYPGAAVGGAMNPGPVRKDGQ